MNGRISKKIRREALKKAEMIDAELLKALRDVGSMQTHAERTEGGAENFNPADASGGNFDDAYDLGEDDGRILLARQIVGITDRILDEEDEVS